MNLNNGASGERAFYVLPDVHSDVELSSTCNKLKEGQVPVEYGAREEGSGSWLVEVRPALKAEDIKRIAQEIGIRLLPPFRLT